MYSVFVDYLYAYCEFICCLNHLIILQVLNPSYNRFSGAFGSPHTERILAEELQSTKDEDFSDEVVDEVHYFGRLFQQQIKYLQDYQ